MKKKYIGIDVSKSDLWVAYQKNQTEWVYHTFENSPESIEELITLLETLSTDLHIVLEATGTYSLWVTYGLIGAGIMVSVLNPHQSKAFQHGVLGRVTKTDKEDAWALCEYGIRNHPPAYVAKAASEHHARQLLSARSAYKKIESMLKNKLHALSYEAFLDTEVHSSLRETLDHIQMELTKIDERLQTLCADAYSEGVKLVQTIPGIGTVTSRTLMTVMGGFTTFDDAKQAARFIGICPSQKDSGSSVRGSRRICRSGSPELRSCLYMCALSAKRYNPDCKRQYERLRRNGKCHKLAMIAVANKLLRQAFSIVKNRTPFDKEYYKKHQS